MWLVFARSPRPDAVLFPGRRLLAVLDALAWPLLGFAAVTAIPGNTGVVGLVAKGLLVFGAMLRCARALACNERYRFTTLRWGMPIAALLVLGAVMKLVA